MPFTSSPSSSYGVVPVPILIIVLTGWCHPVSALALVWWYHPHPSPLTWWCCPCPLCHPRSCIVVTFSSSRCSAILTLTLCCHRPRSRPHVVVSTWSLSWSHPRMVVTVPVPILVLAWWCCRHPQSCAVVPSPSPFSSLCGGVVTVFLLMWWYRPHHCHSHVVVLSLLPSWSSCHCHCCLLSS
jgi:hypothetical protein